MTALNVKLAEDILLPLGINLPYITDGGNLTLEFTITAPDVRGVAQVFSSSFAFGTNPLQKITSLNFAIASSCRWNGGREFSTRLSSPRPQT